MTVYSFHVTYAFQSESALYSCLNVNKHLARSSREICRSSDCNWTRTQNHLTRKRTLNHLAKLAKWLSCVLSTYPYGAFDCMFLSCHVHVSEWIHTLSCLNVKELLAWSRWEIWRLSDCNWTRFVQMVECSFTNWVVLGSSPVAVTEMRSCILSQYLWYNQSIQVDKKLIYLVRFSEKILIRFLNFFDQMAPLKNGMNLRLNMNCMKILTFNGCNW